MQQEVRPSESHLENFKSTEFKMAQCSLIEEYKESEGEVRGMTRAAGGKILSDQSLDIFRRTKVSLITFDPQSVSLVNII